MTNLKEILKEFKNKYPILVIPKYNKRTDRWSFKHIAFDVYDTLEKSLTKLSKNEETCEWKEIELWRYTTGCNKSYLVVRGIPKNKLFKFCPYCGKKIKEVK